MSALLAKCGCDCGACPSYRGNLRSDEDREACSRGWEKYLNIRLSPDKLRPCDGCDVPDDERKVFYLNCRVRQCAVATGDPNCAYCSAFPCEDVRGVHSLQRPDARQRIEARLGASVPEEDYLAFIEPYEGLKHLEAVRAALAPEAIVEMKKVSATPATVAFPAELPLSGEERSAFEALHRLLVWLEVAEDVSYARRLVLEKRRKHLLKLLWAFALFGEFEEAGGSRLVMDSETYLAQHIHSELARLKEYFDILRGYGVCCEHIPLTENGWLTPGGGLRKHGWLLRMGFDEQAGGDAALLAMKTFANRLHQQQGHRALSRFSKADMRALA